MGMEAKNLATVQGIYEAFGKGDIPAIVDTLADDVAWEAWPDNSAQQAGVPWMAGGTGKQAAGAFFQYIGTQFELHDFQVQGIMAGGDMVAAAAAVDVTNKPTGKRFRDEEMHLWTFDANGKVSRFRHYSDTAKQIAAAGKG